MDDIPSPLDKKRGRGKETLFRVMYQHQGHLIQIADNKASMIISICTMIISAIIAITGYGVITGTQLADLSLLFIPVTIILLSCLVGLIYAIRVAKPKIINFKNWENGAHRSSIFFFRVISLYTQEDYVQRMKSLLQQEDDIFEQMTLDIYNLGQVLNAKYRLLKYAYQVLMFGFSSGVLSFIVVILIMAT